MDIEKLIAGLSKEAYGSDVEELLLEAATALSTLQAENEKLLDENRRWSEAMRKLSCAIENLRAELEQVKAERDAESGIEHSVDETGGGGKE